jgi:spermidine/putrescine transport system substrate-binding protein
VHRRWLLDPQKALWLVVALVAAAGLVACGSNSSLASGSANAGEGTGDLGPALNFLNRNGYIDPQVLSEFQRRFGVRVNTGTYHDDDQMLATLRAGNSGYDLVLSSDYHVATLRQEGRLAPLDLGLIANLANLDPAFLNPVYDPANRYCVPYLWGTIGIGYNLEATGREIRSWADFFNPENAGPATMLNDARVALGIALILLGYSPNTTDAIAITAARDFLVSQAGRVTAYTGVEGPERLRDGSYAMVVETSAKLLPLTQQNPSIRYVVPAEGTIIWTDNLCIPAGAPQPALAAQFINYLLEPEAGAAVANYARGASPNQAALARVNLADLSNPALYPPADVRQRLFFLGAVPPAATVEYEQAWAAVLASPGS